ncbi:LOLA3 protein, partial [Acromyrmex charruanus]
MMTRSSRGLRDRALTDASLFRCTPLSNREAAAACVSPLWPDVLVGIKPAETPQDGLRHDPLVVWVEDYQAFDTNTTSSIDHQSSDDHTYVDRLRFRQITSRFKCSKCAKSYRWKHHLVEHIKASCGQEKAECCPYCSYKSNRKWNLKSHMKRIHAREYKEEIKSKCGPFIYETPLQNAAKSRIFIRDLEQARRAVNAVANGMSLRKAAKMYSISKSVLHRYSKRARSVGYLNCQRVTYPCRNCGKVYSYYSSLARHLKHECGVEPKFHCPLCPYRTKHKSSLNTHLNGRHMKLLSEFYTMPNGNKTSSTDAGN